MKSKKFRILGVLLAATMIATTFFMFGCKGSETSSAQKTLKIGVVCWFGWPIGLEGLHSVEVWADMINQKGGLAVGGDKYNIQLISYDTNNNQSTAVAAVNKLVYEDKVKFMISDIGLVDAWLPIAEQNKVILCASSVTPAILSPDLHYCFNSLGLDAAFSTNLGWFFKHMPDKKTFVFGVPDNQQGHTTADRAKAVFPIMGPDRTVSFEFYPETATDLSALGTKVKSLNPDVFLNAAGGPAMEGLAIKAAWQAGYRGQFEGQSTISLEFLSQMVPKEAIEGYISMAWNTEFDPPPTQLAKDFKDAWTAKYGKWDGPEILMTANLGCLLAALQQAGSMDTDKVAAVIGNGLKYECPGAPARMVSRPDMGNNRTTDSVIAYPMKKIVGGKVTVLDAMPIDEAVGYFQQYQQALNK
jgi:branched-chain amino acid transport system substrate-binding protein